MRVRWLLKKPIDHTVTEIIVQWEKVPYETGKGTCYHDYFIVHFCLCNGAADFERVVTWLKNGQQGSLMVEGHMTTIVDCWGQKSWRFKALVGRSPISNQDTKETTLVVSCPIVWVKYVIPKPITPTWCYNELITHQEEEVDVKDCEILPD